MEILAVTHNQHKIKELSAILTPYCQLISLKELNDHDQVVEDGQTYLENALKKGRYFAKKYQRVVLADDSGLMVNYLKGPGVNSRYYSNQGDDANNQLVLKNLQEVSEREAVFTTVLVLVQPSGEYVSFVGETNGTIAQNLKGDNGFGYDQIFYPQGFDQTYAQMSFSQKNKVSHRAKAINLLLQYLSQLK